MSAYVYVGMVGDLFHCGHVALLEKASTYGPVVVGLLTDEGAAAYKRVPVCSYVERHAVIAANKHVAKIVPQVSLDYRPNLLKLKPSYVVHGDDWRAGVQSHVKVQIQQTLDAWGGIIVEVPYTQGISTSAIIRRCVARELAE